jgi:predicted CXXCH cytochrome family protein
MLRRFKAPRILACFYLVLPAVILCPACSNSPSEEAPLVVEEARIPVVLEAPAPLTPPPLPETIPAAMKSCVPCHRSVVAEYLEHGMAGSIGKVGEPPPGVVENPRNGVRYEILVVEGEPRLRATFADGGRREQRLVGRIGAGILDTSWVAEEIDILTGKGTGRLFFAPLETITDHGYELSPFELAEGGAGLDLGLTEGCLTCHTVDHLGALPNAALATSADQPKTAHLFPSNALGADAFEELGGLGCEACHGDARRHLLFMAEDDLLIDDVGLVQLSGLAAGGQRDICARCHLQGDARIDLVQVAPDQEQPLAGQIPVLVPVVSDAVSNDDFRFVGQLERLALAPCFRGSPEMTCTTCHEPHTSAQRQGTARFEAICAGCHEFCTRDPGLEVMAVTGGPARSQAGCVDCHLRRSQPFDLPHIRSVDHYIRRRIPPPQDEIPHRQFMNPDGAVEVYDDGRLAEVFATQKGQRWVAGVEAMGLLTMGRVDAAAERFARFPSAGTAAARTASAPRGLEPLETKTSFHQSRALVLLGTGKIHQALAAFTDALILDPLNAGALLGRARLRFDLGDIQGALLDTQAVIDAYPRAEQPWKLRAHFAERLGRLDLALTAFLAANKNWPSDATGWYKQGLLLRQNGDLRAREALERARTLEPSLNLPGAGPVMEQ